MEINEITIHNLSIIKNTLLKLENSGLGILFVTNNGNKLVGVVTDGDIRRALINGANLDSPIEDIMNKIMFRFKSKQIILKYCNV